MAQRAMAQRAFVSTPLGRLARFSRRPRSRQEAIRPGAPARWAVRGFPGVLLGGLLGSAGPAHAQDFGISVARHFAVRQVDVGTRVARLAFRDTAGLVTIDPRRASATVLAFVAHDCGASLAYNRQMYDLSRTYTPRHVQFYFVESYYGGYEAGKGWAPLADTVPLARLVHADLGSQLANRLSPTHTPEVFIFDSAGVLRYHGSIDDGGDPGGEYTARPVTKPYVRLALEALLAHEPVPILRSKSFGCMVHATHPPGSNS